MPTTIKIAVTTIEAIAVETTVAEMTTRETVEMTGCVNHV
jgi:hypothetical protein